MPAWFQPLNIFLSDLSLPILIAYLWWTAYRAWRAWLHGGAAERRGRQRWFELMAALAIFFSFFAVVYWDRRWNIVPQLDLFAFLGFEWSWPFRVLLIVALERFDRLR